ncbi:RBBP8 N-terminal-like protein isoform X2 [Nycticebus coucang]|uniref:RBBP8 N-terminal-like protein isoform X2 n=1 Tax=Nycticebus coucang TaxID=9470 RepID=UPI00234CA81C|nr:RBBP8 N-terminal-like protein isoform X2 [Nycticebus coucang]XP_053429473.1 RBBP8 N-terminal-like protein isoform X2 [Nycticebus coucang]XP_053429478.1 RBBP8 N-terminal-like protein isoform X2 [Nycticebus coucang]
MESFMESLNRLKEVHEKEVLGLQNKLLELNSERCRDAQRLEELFTKNHHLREQQKALKENLRVLENRLRAGLCDRCMVTQELARRKQREFESAQLQGLQRVFLLTSEMNGLKEENKALKEEVKRLRGLEEKPKPLAREGTSDPLSPLLLPSPGTWKAITEKPSGDPREAEEDQLGTEKPAGHRKSPVAKISPGANLPEPGAPDLSPQHISNQLHGTIALLRPGSHCPAEPGSTSGTPPPLSAKNSPASPPLYEHSFPVDSFLWASWPSAMTHESLKRSPQADNLCLLNHHLSVHLRSPHGHTLAPTATPGNPRLQGLKAREGGTWEEPRQDPRLEGALRLLLTQQQLQARARVGSTRTSCPLGLGEPPPSPPVGSDSEGPESEVARAAPATAVLPGGRHPQPTGLGYSIREEATATPDKPLDLSDRGRSRDAPKPTSQPESLSPTIAHTPSPEPSAPSEALTRSTQALSNGTKRTRVPQTEEPPALTDSSHFLPGAQPSLPSQSRMEDEARGGPDPGGPSEPSKTKMQRPESDDLDKPDSSDSKEHPSSEAGANPHMPGEGPRCICTREQGLQHKRKQASDLEGQASKKLSRGRRKLREALTAAERPGSPRDTQGCSPSPHSSSWEDTSPLTEGLAQRWLST